MHPALRHHCKNSCFGRVPKGTPTKGKSIESHEYQDLFRVFSGYFQGVSGYLHGVRSVFALSGYALWTLTIIGPESRIRYRFVIQAKKNLRWARS